MSLLAKVLSDPSHQKGQNHRSSKNFTLAPPVGVTGIKWVCPNGVTFSVMEDIRGATDPVHLVNISNGVVTAIPQSKNKKRFYIADPSGAQGSFHVEAYTH